MDPAPLREPAAPAIPLSLPPHPPAPAPAAFPLLATIAPMAGAVVLWLVTGSPIALAFAALGPVVAVASVFDARRQARRSKRRGATERASRLEELRDSIAARHEAERADAWRRTPSARTIVERQSVDWSDRSSGPVVLGRGAVPSILRIDGAPVDETDRAVLETAGRLLDAPVLGVPSKGIGIVGPPPLAQALARSLLVQVAHRCRPDGAGVEVPGTSTWEWAGLLPHHARDDRGVIRVVDPTVMIPRGPDAATIALSDDLVALPPGLETVVVVHGPRRAVVEFRGIAPRVVVPELLTEAEAATWARSVGAAAAREGLRRDDGALSGGRELGDLPQPVSSPEARSSLRAAVGMTARGPLEIDLAKGPHAIVGGTTGSGKSEFLLAWVAAMAASHRPSRVSFLLIDFKGGAAFEPLRELPHVAGIVTDLDEAEAERAVQSLRAELRHRESVLRDARVRDIVDLGSDVDLARLVIVVDEYQAMIERFPDLGTVIADIAARGRSLGVHLVLASQRPNGVVREQVTANCPIRVSLRVMQRADSVAVVGTDAAASIGSDTPGRGIADVGDGLPVAFQSARAGPSSLDRIRRANTGVPVARRPWADPLPDRLDPARLVEFDAAEPAPAGTWGIGLVDEPERQRHGLAAWTPAVEGHLLVAGSSGSGRATALAAVAWAAARDTRADPVVQLHGPRSSQWDALHDLLDQVRTRTARGVMLIDDLDIRFRDWPDDYRVAAMSLLESVLREGRACGFAVAAAVAQPHRLPSGVREAFGTTLLLRQPTRSDLLHSGGVGELWRAGDPVGSGQWRGRRLQIVAAPPPAGHTAAVIPAFDLADTARVVLVVSRSPKTDAATLGALRAGVDPIVLEPTGEAAARAVLAASRSHDDDRLVVVGDADAWAASWPLAAQLREDATIVVHGGSREYRVLGSDLGLPPLLDDPVAQCWVIPRHGPVRRAWWMSPDTTETEAPAATRN
ncbi:FtsK/SpoIIIE domain-containing protein [Agromyces sp. Marseille-P2726]|uniref:FtsK/SpoIIIE domain-containing protein n=1 Tax=Agromyces sp. Marseille-P2726 TaxID=2709132 RepID=UPI001570DDB2|nr:FtsK/SpoIIIE domain-containing protein [Agromyces sp. Marseille-P2726]